MVLWDGVALALATRARIRVPEWRVETVAGRRVLLLRRYDRAGSLRVPFLSALAMLGARDNEPRAYLEIADAIRRHGAAPQLDLTELWQRVVFNVLVANTDDHLRNHAFLLAADGTGRIAQPEARALSGSPAGWRLSPAYDLNPVPTDIGPRVLATMIDEHDGEASVDRVLASAEYYGLSLQRARGIVADVTEAVGHWRTEALRMGAAPRECDRMESAFAVRGRIR